MKKSPPLHTWLYCVTVHRAIPLVPCYIKLLFLIVRWTTVAAAGSGDSVLFCAHSEAFNSKYPQSVSGRKNIWKGFVHTSDQQRHIIYIIAIQTQLSV